MLRNLFSRGGPQFLIVGIGNFSPKYLGTRHNAGFLAVDFLAARLGANLSRSRFRSLCGEAAVAGQRALLMKPLTYVNLSGEAAGEAARFYKIPPERVVVICDDTALPLGKLRIRAEGSAGGHNGLKSLIDHLGEGFPRVRIGIGGKPHPDMDLADYVLSQFTAAERKQLDEVFARAADAVELIVAGKLQEAQSQFN